MKKINLLSILILLLISLISCDESTVNEPKDSQDLTTSKVWTYKSSNIDFLNPSLKKIKLNSDFKCQLLINDSWETGQYSLMRSSQSNDIYGVLVDYDNKNIDSVYYRYNTMSINNFDSDTLVIHFGLTQENSWHTYVIEK